MIHDKYKIAVLLDKSRAYERDVLQGLAEFNKIYNCFSFLFYAPGYLYPDNHQQLIQKLRTWKPDGILTRENPSIPGILKLNLPTIISPYTKLLKGAVNLWANNDQIGIVASEYFWKKGYRSFAFLGFKKFQWSMEREAGFKSGIEQYERVHYQSLYFDNKQSDWEKLPVRLKSWLITLEKPCAVFAATDELNVHLVEAVKRASIRVPDDIAILGVDNDELICEMSDPSLSSINQNACHAGFAVGETLFKWIETKKAPLENIIIEPNGVVERLSSKAFAVDDDEVRKAMNFILNKSGEYNISVDDVVKVTNYSRRVLEIKFNELLSSSILTEIKKIKLSKIRMLLSDTKLTIKQIADEVGFENAKNITRYFRNETGIPPSVYRNRSAKNTNYPKKHQIN